MFTKKYIGFFIILFFPMLFVSALINFLYSLNAHDYIQVNWLIVILLAIVLDAFVTWMQTRKEEKNPNNSAK
jgi:dolichyl-phosphate-mannose--protein O-mannosyl transferase